MLNSILRLQSYLIKLGWMTTWLKYKNNLDFDVGVSQFQNFYHSLPQNLDLAVIPKQMLLIVLKHEEIVR